MSQQQSHHATTFSRVCEVLAVGLGLWLLGACLSTARADAPIDASPQESGELASSSASSAPTPEAPTDTSDSDVDNDAPLDFEGADLDATDAAEIVPSDRVAPAVPAEEKRVRFVAFPFVFYLPETNVGFGFGVGVSMLTQRPREGSPMRWYPSNITIGGAYTLNNQLRFILTPEIYLRRGRIVIDGQTEMRFYPDRFYGLGRDTDTAFQRYTDVTFRTSTAIRYQLRPGIYLGGVVDAAVTRIERVATHDTAGNPRPVEPSNQWLGTGGVPGDHDSRVFGIGPTFVFDNRDFTLMTRQGYFFRALAVGFPVGPYRFARGLLDARMFFPFAGGDVVLAAQWVMTVVGGHAPFNHLASVGGPTGLRSYTDGRFRDAMQTFAQVELRFPIFWRFRGAVHVGTGHVFGPASRGDPARVLWAAGVGLRLVLIPDRRLLVRGDVVLGPEGIRILAFVNEAF